MRRSHEGISTFSTPTVLHFGGALLVSAILSAPWRSLTYPAVLLGLAGAYGAAYELLVAYRTKRISTYSADVEDWIWYTVLPFLAYGAILSGALLLLAHPSEALFAFAGGAVALIFVGIHNSWDVVTYITIHFDEPVNADEDQATSQRRAETRPEPRL